MDTTADVRRVPAAGLTLAVREHSGWEPGKQSVVLVHGYPDHQDMWSRVVRRLDHDALHIVTYDVRGAGGSDVPTDTAGYRTELLVEDLVAVVEATVPDGEPVHLVGHDWGSVQLWEVVAAEPTDARLRGRLASFTSISGPSLGHVAHLSRNHKGRRLSLLNQAAHSWYVYAFHLPVLPELVWTAAGRMASRTRRTHWGPELTRNARNGLNLYRANMLAATRRTGTPHTDVPVQVVHPRRDRFLTSVLLEDLELGCSDLSVVEVDAGHWLPRTRPGQVARMVTDHVHAHPGARPR